MFFKKENTFTESIFDAKVDVKDQVVTKSYVDKLVVKKVDWNTRICIGGMVLVGLFVGILIVHNVLIFKV